MTRKYGGQATWVMVKSKMMDNAVTEFNNLIGGGEHSDTKKEKQALGDAKVRGIKVPTLEKDQEKDQPKVSEAGPTQEKMGESDRDGKPKVSEDVKVSEDRERSKSRQDQESHVLDKKLPKGVDEEADQESKHNESQHNQSHHSFFGFGSQNNGVKDKESGPEKHASDVSEKSHPLDSEFQAEKKSEKDTIDETHLTALLGKLSLSNSEKKSEVEEQDMQNANNVNVVSAIQEGNHNDAPESSPSKVTQPPKEPLRVKCQATSKSGKACRNRSDGVSGLCGVHGGAKKADTKGATIKKESPASNFNDKASQQAEPQQLRRSTRIKKS
jgi:hypothetical protein